MLAKKLHLRLFMEGIEVPIVSARVSSGIGRAATAALELVSVDEVHDILPRTLVHLFFYDDDGTAMTGATKIDEKYRLLFAGEYVGYQFTESAQGKRTITLACHDFSSYWDAAKMYFHNEDSLSYKTTLKSKEAGFGGAAEFGTSTGKGAAWTLYKIISSSPACLPGLKGILGGLVHMLESIGGLHRGAKKFRGLNDFFSHAELRLRLAQMIGATVQDDSSRRLMNTYKFRKWLKSSISQNNNTMSFRDVMDMLLGQVFHQYTSIPASYYQPPGDREVEVIVSQRDKRMYNKGLALKAEARLTALKEMRERITAESTIGTRTSRARDEFSAWGPDEMVLGPERRAVEEEYLQTKPGEKAPETATKYFVATGIEAGMWQLGWSEVGSRPATSVAIAEPSAHDGHGAVFGEEGDVTPIGEEVLAADRGRDSGVDHVMNELDKSIEAYQKVVKSGRVFVRQKRTLRVFARLMQHVFSPRLWYAPPPRCNVIFPDQYTTFSHGRQFLAEPTRLMLTSKKEYSSRSKAATEKAVGKKKQLYWAPNVKDINDKVANVSAKKGARLLLPHEVFTGIIPRFDSVPDIDAFVSSERDQRRAGDSKTKLPYMQRLAEYTFFDARYTTRTGVVHMPFSPQIVAGFPVLVVSKTLPTAVQQERGTTPRQYLGLAYSLEHSLSQTGGTTEVLLSHLRTHRDQAEFLGGPRETTLVKRVGSKVKKKTKVVKVIKETGKALETTIPVVGKRGDVGTIVSVEAVGEAVSVESSVSQDFQDNPRSVAPTEDGISSLEIERESREIALQTYIVSEKVGVFEKTPVRLPLEETVRPPWAAPIYRNMNIGKQFYDKMLGCLSLVDNWYGPVVLEDEAVQEQLEWELEADEAVNLHPVKVTYSKPKLLKYKGMVYGRYLADGTAVNFATPPIQIDPKTGKPVTQVPIHQDFQTLPTSADDSKLADEANKSRGVLATMASGATIVQSVDRLVGSYVSAQRTGDSTLAFSREYTWRPIATMKDILGSLDLQFDLATGTVSSGEEGFHSRAFGKYNEMELLQNSEVSELGGVGVPRKVDPKADPRGMRRESVQRLIVSLEDRAIRG